MVASPTLTPLIKPSVETSAISGLLEVHSRLGLVASSGDIIALLVIYSPIIHSFCSHSNDKDSTRIGKTVTLHEAETSEPSVAVIVIKHSPTDSAVTLKSLSMVATSGLLEDTVNTLFDALGGETVLVR